MKPPEVPTKGPKAFRKLAKDVIEYMVATKPIAGSNVNISELPSGTQIYAQAGSGGFPVKTFFIRNGVLVTYNLTAQSGPTTVQ